MTCHAIQPNQSGNEHILSGVFADQEWLGPPKPALEACTLSQCGMNRFPYLMGLITRLRDNKQQELSSSSLDYHMIRTTQQWLPTVTAYQKLNSVAGESHDSFLHFVLAPTLT